jgi:4-amino-4-deoxy-L-arabinose transferase-like glycosyltransferase
MVCVFLVMWRVQHEFQWKIYEVIGAGLEQRTICRQFYKMQAVGAINMLLAHNNMVGYLWTAFLTENEPGAMDKSVVLTVRELYLAVFACTILVYFAAERGGRKNQLKWMVFAMVGLVGQLALVGVLIRMMHIYQPQAQASPILSGIVALVAFYYTTRSMLNLKKGLGTVLAGQEVLYQQRAHKMDLD